MNTLRLLANAIKTNQGTINCVGRQWNNEQICYLKRATTNFSTTAAVFIRNTTITTTVGPNTNKPTFFGSSKECNLQGYQLLLPQQLQCASTNMSSLLYCGQQSCRRFGTKSSPDRANKSDAKSAAVADAEVDIFADSCKLGLFARFKLMYKMYWYILIPVHVVTSAGWLGGFYYLSQSGVDIPALLQYMHLSETIIEKFQGSSLGHWAVALLCYKLATPVRYAVTLGGSTISIKYLVQQGYIKPIPSKTQILQMYEDKKAQRAADKANKENEEKHKHENK